MSFVQDLERSGKWILGSVIVFFTLHNAGIIEGKIAPVVSVAALTVLTDEDNDGWAEVSGNFTKLRQCDLHTIEWFWQGETGATRVAVLRTTAAIRKTGVQHFAKLQVHMPHTLIKNESYAVAYHNCHLLWTTQTKFYP